MSPESGRDMLLDKIKYITNPLNQIHETYEYLAAMEIVSRSCLGYYIDKEYRPDAAQSARFIIA